jgi:hypothetical protein
MAGSIGLMGSMTGVRNAVLNWSKMESLAGSSSQPNWAKAGDNNKAVMRRNAFMVS